MGGVPKPILYVVAIGLALSAAAGFALGVTQTGRRTASTDAVPIAANLPADVVIKDAQPLLPPPPPPPPKAKAQDDDDSDEASDDAPVLAAPRPDHGEEPSAPPVSPGPPSKPGAALPDDLPPT